MSAHEDTMTITYYVEWDMGTYGPFADTDEARMYQRANGMAGSTVVRSDELGEDMDD